MMSTVRRRRRQRRTPGEIVKAKDGAKSDALDAIRVARETLGRDRLSIPRAHDGMREAIRVHAVTRAAAVRARTGAINEFKAIIVTADETIRAPLRGLRTAQQVTVCARFRDRSSASIEQRCTRACLRALARRLEHLNAEVDDHDRMLTELLDQTAPQLIAERGIGYVTAAAFYIAWSHPGRCPSEAAFARLGGTSPVEATSGQNQTRHRLNRGGDRQLNRALYHVAITKQRCDPATKAYIARRTAEGKPRTRNHPLHQTIHRPPRLATPRTPANRYLTDIRASPGVSFEGAPSVTSPRRLGR